MLFCAIWAPVNITVMKRWSRHKEFFYYGLNIDGRVLTTCKNCRYQEHSVLYLLRVRGSKTLLLTPPSKKYCALKK